mmetsp:Transcript_1892/g.3778  ORF Transcript_1892/g.3778 Transcript_1892/m.3778 type:complete len:208 (-) Transcript_1892:284-907(-)
MKPLIPEMPGVLLGVNFIKVILMIFLEADEVLEPQQCICPPYPRPHSENAAKALLRGPEVVLLEHPVLSTIVVEVVLWFFAQVVRVVPIPVVRGLLYNPFDVSEAPLRVWTLHLNPVPHAVPCSGEFLLLRVRHAGLNHVIHVGDLICIRELPIKLGINIFIRNGEDLLKVNPTNALSRRYVNVAICSAPFKGSHPLHPSRHLNVIR